MTTPRTRKLACSTCKGKHQHRQLTGAEQQQAKEQLRLRAVHDFWLCENVVDAETSAQCRNLRRYLQWKPFSPPVKLQVPE
ncbi:hypothetical protein ABZ759_03540 [Streptomyces sp. NPDC047860]|uniref:hypothetical protein n=1 Tax=Streptomyces sp. NPDC047860 TaxID=3155743 RepID=UPI0033E0C3DC